ncbi:MAG: ribosome biogenesis GTPase Der [Cyanobacteria bacterium SIG30]|nr:ribosome biogenesis GTPase Der [Cyanobacteria bacterium SIG30]
MKEKIIAVVGRPNVGKSTLVNRIIGSRKSIVDDMAGVTRDRIYFDAEWQDKKFTLIDTGGIITDDNESEFVKNIFTQAQIAMNEADLILFVVDGKSGLSPYDKDIANILRQSDKKVLLVVNKIDDIAQIGDASEFYTLSLGEPMAVSALHGSGGIGDLLDVITQDIERDEENLEDEAIKIAIVGKPNAGKSSILNRLLKQERAIVSNISGTTRDSINSEITIDEQDYVLIDTAGIRKKSKVDFGIEAFAIDRALRSIREADVALLVIDSTEGLTDQDKKIAQTIEEAGCGIIVAFNKWDLVKNVQTHDFEQKIEQDAPFLNYAEKIFISAKTGQRLDRIFKEAKKVADERNKRIQTGILNKVINDSIAINPPVSVHGKMLRVYYTTQVKTKPPTFVIFINNLNLLKDSYKRYLTKKMRETFGFFGTPIRINFREKKKQKGDK